MPAPVNRPIKNVGNSRYFVKPPKGYPGKRYIGGRYAYEYNVKAWQKTGRLPKKNEVTHHKGNPSKSVGYMSRSKHYSGHGAPYAKGGKGLTTLFKKRSPLRPRGVVKRKM